MSIKEKMQAVIDTAMEHINGEPGWSVMSVFGGEGEPGFSYTVGLETSFGHPELIVYGLSPQLMHQMLNEYGRRIKEGHVFTDGEIDSEGYNLPVAFRQCSEVGVENLRLADVINSKLKARTRAFQLFWTDKNGRFPWDRGFDESFRPYQPENTILPKKGSTPLH